MKTPAGSSSLACRAGVVAAGLAFAAMTGHGEPSAEAEFFADGTISSADSYTLTLTADQSAAYFCRALTAGGKRRGTIMESTCNGAGWSAPRIAAFSGEFTDMDPMLSPDGAQLFFASVRPPAGNRPTLWVADRTANGWSPPRHLAEITGAEGVAVFPCSTASGNLYFAGHGPGWTSEGDDDIYVARRRPDGTYAEPENLGPAVNSAAQDYDAYVAPDESLVVFASRRDGPVPAFYFSTRGHGAWMPARRLPPVVNFASDPGVCGPYVSADRRWFYFTSVRDGHRGIFRMSAAAAGLPGSGIPR